MLKLFISILLLLIIAGFQQPSALTYPWKSTFEDNNRLIFRIPVPAGYQRVSVQPLSFGDWLRNIPLKAGKPEVLLYNGKKKLNQTAQYAVVDIDTGTKDLQQYADAVIRLRSEYLFSIKYVGNIHFNFTNGFWFSYMKWVQGNRVKVTGNKAEWTYPVPLRVDRSYEGFRKYLETAFMYCGTQSLSREMKAADVKDVQPGDVFIRGGSPGHAVLVMDVAVSDTGQRIFLLSQSYMPAQDIHVLVNPNDPGLSPWYADDFGEELRTPEWVFGRGELRRF